MNSKTIYSRFKEIADRYPEAPAIIEGDQDAAMLAVLKSGAGYIPAEPSLPQERIDYMMQNAGGRSYNKRQLLPSSAGRRQRNGRPLKT